MTVVVGAEHENRGADPRRAQLETLFDQGDRQGVAQRLERPRHRDGAMSVGIRLDDTEQADPRPDQLPQARQVPLHGPEIDLGDRGTDGGADVDFGKRDAYPFYRSPADFGMAGQSLQSFTRARRSVNSCRCVSNLGHAPSATAPRQAAFSMSRLLTSRERPRGVSRP